MKIIIAGASRGGCLRRLENKDILVITIRGGKIEQLTELVLKELEKGPVDFVYFVAGLPDVSSRLREYFYLNSRKCRYEEFVFTEDPEHAQKRVRAILADAETKIKEKGAIPVFSTITPFSINHWNHHRLQNHCTSHLLHFNTYQTQQENLHTAINNINIDIREINRANQVLTPKPSSFIAYKRRGHWRYRYGKLGDGTHTNAKIKRKWVQHYAETIEKNNNNLARRPLTSPHELEFDYEVDFSIGLDDTTVETDPVETVSDFEYGPTYSTSEDPDSPAED